MIEFIIETIREIQINSGCDHYYPKPAYTGHLSGTGGSAVPLFVDNIYPKYLRSIDFTPYLNKPRLYIFDLKSECINNKRGKIKVIFAGPGIGIGLDYSATKGEVKLTDPFEFINISAFNGDGYIAQAGLSWPPTQEQRLGQVIAGQPNLNPPHGGGCSSIQLGLASGTGCGGLYGFNISAEALYGSSTIWDVEIEDCCDN